MPKPAATSRAWRSHVNLLKDGFKEFSSPQCAMSPVVPWNPTRHRRSLSLVAAAQALER